MKKGVVFACVLAVLSMAASVYTVVKVNNNDDKEVVTKEVTARNIMLRQADDYLQWKYDDEDNWKNLISISLLKGADGKDGKDGIDGRNGTNGKDGVNGQNGADGINGRDGTNGNNGTNGTNGTNGNDGREVEFKVEGTKIYWKYNTETEWTLLIDVSTLNEEPEEEEPIEESCETRDIIADAASVACIANGTTCTPGTLVKVNLTTNTTDEPATFYVINDNPETGKLTLIADRNIGADDNWYSWNTNPTGTSGNNIYGPIVAMKALNDYIAEKNWDNVCSIKNYTYENEGRTEGGSQYLSISIANGNTKIVNGDSTESIIEGVTKARMLTYDEAVNAGGCTSQNKNFCNWWMYTNLTYNTSNPPPVQVGYWLLASTTSTTTADVVVMKNNSSAGEYQGKLDSSATNGTNRGIRPVIEVTKPINN